MEKFVPFRGWRWWWGYNAFSSAGGCNCGVGGPSEMWKDSYKVVEVKIRNVPFPTQLIINNEY